MMKNFLPQIALLFVMSVSFVSCSKEDVAQDPTTVTAQPTAKYNYTSEEEEVLRLVNEYRKSKGLTVLEKIDYMSSVAEGHDNYMISVGKVSHDYFQDRYQALVTNLGAKNASENVAYNYATPQSVFNAWLASDGHRANIEGKFTHFGIAIRVNSEGKKYYTNLFMLK
ncbi:CAP domain-containing protein [Flavobacterium sp.]|uniref:CAP domain-containing protein n=1 Tax=Flavobacterium sp. TaxID=239 RepID=UPI003D1035E7